MGGMAAGMMTPTVLVALAGLMGAAGVVLLAAGAHAAPGAGLDSAGQMLLLHAAAVLALAALLAQGSAQGLAQSLAFRPLALAAALGFVAGATLFSADIAMRAFAAHRLFPFAAPSGGFILIASWVAVAVAAVVALARG